MKTVPPQIFLFLCEITDALMHGLGERSASKAVQKALARIGLRLILRGMGLAAELRITPEGRPVLTRSDEGPEVHVSWSHSGTTIAWAVGPRTPVGIDIEWKVPRADRWEAYLEPLLSPAEKDWLKENPGRFTKDDFLPFLTEKEAVFKVYSGAVGYQDFTVLPRRTGRDSLFFHQSRLEPGGGFLTACALTKVPPLWQVQKVQESLLVREIGRDALLVPEQDPGVH